MTQRASLKTLYRVRQQEVERENREVARIRQQLARVAGQIVQLEGYREDYRIQAGNGQRDPARRIQDRQLFLARLEQSIDTLVQNREDLSVMEKRALQDLLVAYERAEALRKTIERREIGRNQEKLRLEQSQCDEQGRTATKCRLGTGC